jgi:hypothetical protein
VEERFILKSNQIDSIQLEEEVKKRQTNNKKVSIRQHGNMVNITKSKMKTIKLTLTVIIMYIICSTPYFIGMLLNIILPPQFFNNDFLSIHFCFSFFRDLNLTFVVCFFLEYFTVLSCLLFQLNSCVNPWIYLTFNFKMTSFIKSLRHSN